MAPPTTGYWHDRATEVATLAAAGGRLRLPVLAYDGRSLPNVTGSVVRSSGSRIGAGPPLAPPLDADLDPFGGRRAEGPILVVLVDGFGWAPFAEWARGGRSEACDRWGRRAKPITTVFPTTTTAALTSLSTGTPPDGTALPGTGNTSRSSAWWPT